MNGIEATFCDYWLLNGIGATFIGIILPVGWPAVGVDPVATFGGYSVATSGGYLQPKKSTKKSTASALPSLLSIWLLLQHSTASALR